MRGEGAAGAMEAARVCLDVDEIIYLLLSLILFLKHFRRRQKVGASVKETSEWKNPVVLILGDCLE